METSFDFVRLARKHAELAIELAKLGWYPTPHSPVNVNLRKLSEPKLINDFLLERHKRFLSENTTYCLDNAPERNAPLNAGIRLHKAGEFYGSVPIFLAQAEGVFNEVFNRSIFSNKHRSYEKINEKRELEEGQFFDAFLASTFVNSQIGADKSKCTEKQKLQGPNRNGVMHGDIRHVDYGTELNSMKAFSLMCCAIWLSKSATEI